MRPFKQTEAAKTKTAITITVPSDKPLYSAPVQQTPVRQKLNYSLSQLNGQAASAFQGVI